jgi:hypothetical protein
MKCASSWSGDGQVGGGDVRWEGEGLFQRMVARMTDVLLHRRRHRPVRYGGREFSAPQGMSEAILPAEAGLYAIQVRDWWSGMAPIYFGASGNLHEELMIDGHEGFMDWVMHRGARRGLFVSFDVADDLDHEGRRHEGIRLNRHYFPRRLHSLDEHLAHHRIQRTSGHRRGDGHARKEP